MWTLACIRHTWTQYMIGIGGLFVITTILQSVSHATAVLQDTLLIIGMGHMVAVGGDRMPSLSCHQSAAVQVPPFDMERSSSFEQISRPQEQRLSQEGSQGLVGIQQSIP